MAIHFEKFELWQRLRRLSDQDVAAIAGCSHTTIGRYKRGEIATLDPSKKARICDASSGQLRPGDFAEYEDELARSREASRAET